MKILIFCLFPYLAFSTVLNLSGEINGHYIADTINVNNAFGDTLILCAEIVNIGNSNFTLVEVLNKNCEVHCDDQLTPGIAVLLDSCIRDEEWNENYAPTLIDSSSFFTSSAMDLFQLFGIRALDDCGIDTFFVDSLEILPPGGVDRPTNGTKEFRIHFKAIDFTGKEDEETMIWIRNNDGCI